MKTKNQLFSLDILIGNWESVNLNPTIIIYKNNKIYMLSVIHINETTRQAHPATYEIQKDKGGYYIVCNSKRIIVNYDARLDSLNLTSFGDYIRN